MTEFVDPFKQPMPESDPGDENDYPEGFAEDPSSPGYVDPYQERLDAYSKASEYGRSLDFFQIGAWLGQALNGDAETNDLWQEAVEQYDIPLTSVYLLLNETETQVIQSGLALYSVLQESPRLRAKAIGLLATISVEVTEAAKRLPQKDKDERAEAIAKIRQEVFARALGFENADVLREAVGEAVEGFTGSEEDFNPSLN